MGEFSETEGATRERARKTRARVASVATHQIPHGGNQAGKRGGLRRPEQCVGCRWRIVAGKRDPGDRTRTRRLVHRDYRGPKARQRPLAKISHDERRRR